MAKRGAVIDMGRHKPVGSSWRSMDTGAYSRSYEPETRPSSSATSPAKPRQWLTSISAKLMPLAGRKFWTCWAMLSMSYVKKHLKHSESVLKRT